jgi:hypothetical protein
MILISYPRVLAVPSIPRGPSYLCLLSYPKGIGGAANTLGPLIRNIYFISEGIGGAANTPEVPQTYLALLIVVFIETIINLEHMNISMISLNQDIPMHL